MRLSLIFFADIPCDRPRSLQLDDMPKPSPDSGLPLQPVEYRGVTLDVCAQTGGIWFDVGELGKLRRMSYDCLEGLDTLVKQGSQEPTVDPSSRKCPVDGTLLFPFFYGLDNHIQLEECHQCGGIWCDHKALDKIAAIVQRENPNYVPDDLAPEAKQALDEMCAEQNRFMARASVATSFFRIIDQRPFWPAGWPSAVAEHDVDEGKPWL